MLELKSLDPPNLEDIELRLTPSPSPSPLGNHQPTTPTDHHSRDAGSPSNHADPTRPLLINPNSCCGRPVPKFLRMSEASYVALIMFVLPMSLVLLLAWLSWIDFALNFTAVLLVVCLYLMVVWRFAKTDYAIAIQLFMEGFATSFIQIGFQFLLLALFASIYYAIIGGSISNGFFQGGTAGSSIFLGLVAAFLIVAPVFEASKSFFLKSNLKYFLRKQNEIEPSKVILSRIEMLLLGSMVGVGIGLGEAFLILAGTLSVGAMFLILLGILPLHAITSSLIAMNLLSSEFQMPWYKRLAFGCLIDGTLHFLAFLAASNVLPIWVLFVVLVPCVPLLGFFTYYESRFLNVSFMKDSEMNKNKMPQKELSFSSEAPDEGA